MADITKINLKGTELNIRDAGAARSSDLTAKQDALVSGTNIKTINNQSLLGSGNISIVAPDEVREGKLVNGSWYAWNSVSYDTTATTMSQKDAGALFIDLPTKEFYRYTGSAFEKLLTGKAEKAGSENQLFTAQGLYVTSHNDSTTGISIDAAYDSSTQEDTLEISASNGSLNYTFNGNSEEIATKSDLVTPIVTVSTTGAVTQALSPNTFYNFTGSPTSLTLTLVPGTNLSIYAGKFTAGTGFSNLSFPASVKVAAGCPDVEAGGVYEFSVVDNLLVIAMED